MDCYNCKQDDSEGDHKYLYNGRWWCRECIEREIEYLKELLN